MFSSNRKLTLSLSIIAVFMLAGLSNASLADKAFVDDTIYLRDIFRRALSTKSIQSDLKIPIVVENDYLLVGNQRITILPIVENKVRRNGNLHLGARFEVLIEGNPQPHLIFGTVGVGVMRRDVMADTVFAWYYSFGRGLLRALANASPDETFKNYSLYTGATQIRGKSQENFVGIKSPWTILHKLSPMLPQPDGNLHTIAFALWINNGRISSGECRIDGEIISSMCESLKDFDWPLESSEYMYKQAYVLK